MISVDKHKSEINPESDDGREYLYHHMHHFLENGEIIHELHHCFLFENEGMKGKKYSIKHLIDNNYVYHCIDEIFEGDLFDHANNKFEIKKLCINKKYYYVIND